MYHQGAMYLHSFYYFISSCMYTKQLLYVGNVIDQIGYNILFTFGIDPQRLVQSACFTGSGTPSGADSDFFHTCTMSLVFQLIFLIEVEVFL
jgi:hypothetical protein